jgi:hypothetical protein
MHLCVCTAQRDCCSDSCNTPHQLIVGMLPVPPQASCGGAASHLHEALVCAVDLISKDVEQHLTVTVSLQVPAAGQGQSGTGSQSR